jgi:hypothetical protein
MELCPLTERDWPSLHKLMVQRKFPHVPRSYAAAKQHFAQAKAFGLKQGLQPKGGIEAAFLFGPPDNGVAFFDAVCSPAQEGRWAMPNVLRALFTQAFAAPPLGLGLRAVWVQTHGSKALNAALKAGFIAATPLSETAQPVLVITPNLVPRSLHTPTPDNQHM